jgi:hypothetical protein
VLHLAGVGCRIAINCHNSLAAARRLVGTVLFTPLGASRTSSRPRRSRFAHLEVPHLSKRPDLLRLGQ